MLYLINYYILLFFYVYLYFIIFISNSTVVTLKNRKLLILKYLRFFLCYENISICKTYHNVIEIINQKYAILTQF